MSETLRGFVLLLSLLLWTPALPPLLAGTMGADEAGLRYGAALLFAWGGCTALAALVRAYTPPPTPPEPPAAVVTAEAVVPEQPAGDAPQRRAEDLSR